MTTETEPVRVGVAVKCRVCGNVKKPLGRSAPLGTFFCEDYWDGQGCVGYGQEPYPGSLWPGETSAEFGYPVGPHGTVVLPAPPTGDER